MKKIAASVSVCGLLILVLAVAGFSASALGGGIEAPSVAQLTMTTPPGESLWHFLAALPGTMEAQVWYALLIGGVIGMLGHYVRGRAGGEIAGNPFEYFFKDNVWRSLAAAGAVAAELFTEVGSGLFTTTAGHFVGWGIVILSGIKTGYLGDSILNKSNRPVWTDDQRAAKVAPQAQEAQKP